MAERPKHISISQASKISGIAKSSIIHHISKGLYGKVKSSMQGKRPVKQIPVDKFVAVCEEHEIELDWTVLDRSGKRSMKRSMDQSVTDRSIGSGSIGSNEIQQLMDAMEEQFKERLSEKDRDLLALQRQLEDLNKQSETANERLERAHEQAAIERAEARAERQELNDARNFFEAQRNFLMNRIERLGRRDGLQLLAKGRLNVEGLPTSERPEDEVIDADVEEVGSAQQKPATQS